MMRTRVSYLDEQLALEGYLAAPDSARALPGVLLVPSWLNVNQSICTRADRLAGLLSSLICSVPVFGQVHHNHR